LSATIGRERSSVNGAWNAQKIDASNCSRAEALSLKLEASATKFKGWRPEGLRYEIQRLEA